MPIARTVLLLSLVLSGTATAQTPSRVVLHAGDLPTALEKVQRDTGTQAALLDGRRPGSLLPGDKPIVAGKVRINRCGGKPATNAELHREIAAAAEMWLAMDIKSADTRLAGALSRVVCLSEPLEPSMAARGAFLRGAILHALGDTPGAKSAFGVALRYRPELTFDADIPPDAAPLFKEAKAARESLAPATIQIVPGQPGALDLRVDGHSAAAKEGKIALSSGTHLLQVVRPVSITLEVTIEANTTTSLVLPGMVKDEWATQIDDPARRADLLGLIRASSIGQSSVVFVPGKTGTWSLEPEADVWQLKTRSIRDRLQQPLLVAGGVSLASGAVVMAIYASQAAAVRSDISEDQASTSPTLNTATYRAKLDTLARHRTWYWTGAGVATAGLIAAGTGAWLRWAPRTQRVHVQPVPMLGGGGLLLTTRGRP